MNTPFVPSTYSVQRKDVQRLVYGYFEPIAFDLTGKTIYEGEKLNKEEFLAAIQELMEYLKRDRTIFMADGFDWFSRNEQEIERDLCDIFRQFLIKTEWKKVIEVY